MNTPVGPMLQRFTDAATGLSVWLFISMAIQDKPRTPLGLDDASWLGAPLLLAALCIRHGKDGKLNRDRTAHGDHAALAMCLLGIAAGFTLPLLKTPGLGALLVASSSLAFGFAKLSRHWGMDHLAQALLWKACRDNQSSKVFRALSLGACPLSENARGISPLKHCCQSGKADLATLMLDASSESSTHAHAIQNALATAIDAKQTRLATLLHGRLPDAWTPPNSRRWRQTIDSIRWRDPSWLQQWMAHVLARNEKAKIAHDLPLSDLTPTIKRQRNTLDGDQPLRDPCATLARPLRDPCATLARPLRDPCATLARHGRTPWIPADLGLPCVGAKRWQVALLAELSHNLSMVHPKPLACCR